MHEAYLRLIDGEPTQQWDNRWHFFAAAAEAMRRILVEQARHKNRIKHGGKRQRIDLDSACAVREPPSIDLLALDEALTKLATNQPAKAELVKLRFFAGLTMPEAAAALGISLATAERHWTFARSWLYAQIAESSAPPTLKNRISVRGSRAKRRIAYSESLPWTIPYALNRSFSPRWRSTRPPSALRT